MRNPLWAAWGALVFMVATGIAVRVLTSTLEWRSEAVAAWVQAIGSISAVGAAIGLAAWERAHARAEALQRRRDYRMAVAALADDIANAVADHAADLVRRPTYWLHEGSRKQDFDDLADALEWFDPSQLMSASGAVAMMQLSRECRRAEQAEAWITSDMDQFDDISPDTDEYLGLWVAAARRAQATLRTLASE